MKKRTTYCYLFISLFLTNFLCLNAESTYRLQQDNLNEVAREIHLNYQYVLEEDIRVYLQAQLDYLPLNSEIPYPKINQSNIIDNNHIFFGWASEEGQFIYHGSHKSLITSNEGFFDTPEPEIDLYLSDHYNLQIYTFAAIGPEEAFQSIISIFIVDANVFSSSPRPLRSPQPNNNSNFLDLGNSPNPFAGQTTFFFELYTDSPVSLHLYAPHLQISHPNYWQGQLSPGKHEIPLDLSDLPHGIYYGILQTNRQQQYFQMVLLEN